jgi:hypothetical protein
MLLDNKLFCATGAADGTTEVCAMAGAAKAVAAAIEKRCFFITLFPLILRSPGGLGSDGHTGETGVCQRDKQG